MEQMSRTERAALCNSALEAGEAAPTLCAGWAVKDLVIHLLIRERDPIAATAIMVPQLEKVADRKANRLAQQDFTALVERVRNGPPRWSPMAIPPVDQLVNSLEYFVHHEDIRRATPGWAPRELTDREQRILFKGATVAGKRFVKSVDVPVEIHWTDGQRERTAVLASGDDPVVITGEPAELTMFLFGRDQHTGLKFEGPQDAIDKLQTGDLGI
jgi:uncharacterized protein (TIGR03085 family)